MRRNAVILFTGDARREEAEKGLPPRFLARLHATHAKTIASLPDVDLLIARHAAGAFRKGGPELLGRRIDEAVRDAFASGYERVAIVAGDVLTLDRATLGRAFASPATAVVGRSPDGGFYLAAFDRPPDIEWTSLPWCTRAVCQALLDALSGFTIELLEEVEDVDEPNVRDPKTRALIRSLLDGRISIPPGFTAIRRAGTPRVTRGPPLAG